MLKIDKVMLRSPQLRRFSTESHFAWRLDVGFT